jgi:hypothetical protein
MRTSGASRQIVEPPVVGCSRVMGPFASYELLPPQGCPQPAYEQIVQVRKRLIGVHSPNSMSHCSLVCSFM